jgi:hypothetical protein
MAIVSSGHILMQSLIRNLPAAELLGEAEKCYLLLAVYLGRYTITPKQHDKIIVRSPSSGFLLDITCIRHKNCFVWQRGLFVNF